MNTLTIKKSRTAIVYALGIALLCGATRAEEPVGIEGESEEDEDSFVSAEFSMAFDSKYLSYGFVDNNEPIMTPSASLTFFDWVTVGATAYFDVTHYGRKAGYTSRAFQCIEFHPNISIGHEFSPDDYEWLPTTIAFDLNYDYEYLPNARARENPDDGWSEDTQYWTLEISLPDLWLEPCFYAERDTMRDNGTYMNLEIGHTFSLVDGDGEDDDPVLSIRPSIAQGFGNAPRVRAYATRYWEGDNGEEFEKPLDHAGLMDTLVKCELNWNICDNLSLSGYVGYSDFLFDRKIRDCARDYEATEKWDDSWNFIGGLAITASF